MENKKERVFLSASCEDTEKIAFEFAKELKQGDFIAFFGDLGSGKTAFTRGVAQYLCPSAEKSPFFTLICIVFLMTTIFFQQAFTIISTETA